MYLRSPPLSDEFLGRTTRDEIMRFIEGLPELHWICVTEFAELIKEHFLPLPRLFSKLIEELFGGETEELPRSGVVPPIEDASQKLKENFGRTFVTE